MLAYPYQDPADALVAAAAVAVAVAAARVAAVGVAMLFDRIGLATGDREGDREAEGVEIAHHRVRRYGLFVND